LQRFWSTISQHRSDYKFRRSEKQ